MVNRISVKEILRDAIEELHSAGMGEVTQSQIAERLGVTSKKLNKTRQDALEELVQNGTIERRIKPGDARNIQLYAVPNPNQIERMSMMNATDKDFYEDRFYTALFAYLDLHANFSKTMQHVPQNLSADEWLAKANQFAEILSREYHVHKRAEIEKILAWVERGDFDTAWQHIRKQSAKIDARIRKNVHA